MNNITEFISSFFSKNVSKNIVVKNLDVYFFSTSWCPHSAKKIPIFKEFMLSYNHQIINGFKINCINVDCSDQENQTAIDLIKSMNIEFYPCVKIVKDEEIVVFEGNITQEDMIKKIYSILHVTII